MSTTGLGGGVDPFPGETCPTSPGRLHVVCHYLYSYETFFLVMHLQNKQIFYIYIGDVSFFRKTYQVSFIQSINVFTSYTYYHFIFI